MEEFLATERNCSRCAGSHAAGLSGQLPLVANCSGPLLLAVGVGRRNEPLPGCSLVAAAAAQQVTGTCSQPLQPGLVRSSALEPLLAPARAADPFSAAGTDRWLDDGLLFTGAAPTEGSRRLVPGRGRNVNELCGALMAAGRRQMLRRSDGQTGRHGTDGPAGFAAPPPADQLIVRGRRNGGVCCRWYRLVDWSAERCLHTPMANCMLAALGRSPPNARAEAAAR